MENSNITKQAKSDIFGELKPIINFYISKGAKASALKKYYKNNKRFDDILDDIKNKGVNLVKDEQEYKKLVREILNDILDDIIAKEKDDEYKNKPSKNMKNLKKFESFSDDDDDFSLEGYYRAKLEAFRERLNSAKTIEDVRKLKELAKKFEEENSTESIEGEWSDFKIYLSRKSAEVSPNGVDADVTFESNELNKFLDQLRNAKSQKDIDNIVSGIHRYSDKIDPRDYAKSKEFKEFVEFFNDSAYDIVKGFKSNESKKYKNVDTVNEGSTLTLIAIGFFLYKFLKSILKNKISKSLDKPSSARNDSMSIILNELKKMDKIPVVELADRYFIRLTLTGYEVDIRISKMDKTIELSDGIHSDIKVKMSDIEYSEFLSLIKK